METFSLLLALALVVVLGIGYKLLRRRGEPRGSAPEQFFGVGDETVLTEMRSHSPSELPPPADRPEPGQPPR
jgi:hypothetical protein